MRLFLGLNKIIFMLVFHTICKTYICSNKIEMKNEKTIGGR